MFVATVQTTVMNTAFVQAMESVNVMMATTMTGSQVKDCSMSVVEEFKSEWDALRFVLVACFSILAAISVFGLYYYGVVVKKMESSSAPITNIRVVVLVAIFLSSIAQALYCGIDPKSLYGKINPVVDTYLYGCTYWICMLAFVSLLFHWVNLYNVAIADLKKEEMLQKINTNYRGTVVTVEHVVQQVRFLRKLKIPFVIVISCLFFSHLAWSIVEGLKINYVEPRRWFYIYLTLNLLVLCLGFLFYGRRLVQLMPYELSKKVKKLTFRITLLSIYMLVSLVIVYIVVIVLQVTVPTGVGFMVRFALIQFNLVGLGVAILSVFIKVGRKFPYCFSRRQDSSSSHRDSQVSHSTLVASSSCNPTSSEYNDHSSIPMSAV